MTSVSNELKIFITFFIIFSFFAQWNDIWDFNSYFALTKAIVEEGRFEIDTYHNTTEVKLFYNGHYYSAIVPGISFLITWAYALGKNLITSSSLHEFLIVVLSNSVLGALSSVMIYKISNFFTKSDRHRLLTTLSYGFATSIFLYALGFYAYIPAILFTLLAFYLILREKTRDEKRFHNFFLAGIFSGIACLIYPVSIFIIVPFLVYISIIDKKMLLFFLVGCIIGILPILLRNYGIYGSLVEPFEYSLSFLKSYTSSSAINSFWIGKGGYLEKWLVMWIPPEVNYFKVLPRVLFFPWNGLFFYYPLLFVAFLGLLLMCREKKLEGYLFLAIFVLIWVGWAAQGRWWGDFSFGPRRFLLAIPFLSLGLPYIFKVLDLKVFLIFLILSLFTNLLGLQMWTSLECVLQSETGKTYFQKVENFQFFMNPLKEIYFPSFLRDGPRSLLFENLIFDGKINIRFGENIEHLKNYGIKLFSLPSNVVLLKIPFLNLVPLAIIMFLIWSRDIFQNERIKKFLNRKRIIIIVMILLLIFFFAFVKIVPSH